MRFSAWLTDASRSVAFMVGRYEWPIVGLVAAAALSLGLVGFVRLDASLSLLDALYRTLQLLVLQGGDLGGRHVPWELQIARFLIPAIGAYVGLKAVAGLFREQAGLLLAQLRPPSIVVCGLGDRGFLITRSLREQGERVLVIEKDGTNQLIRLCRRAGAIVLVGDATDPEVLRTARVHRARHVICVSGEDRTNGEMAARARELALREGSRGLTLNVHIVDPQLQSFLKASELGEHRPMHSRLDCFNVFDAGARALVRDHPPDEVLRADGKAHVMVLGLGRLAERLIVHAARHWERSRKNGVSPLRITVVDREAQAKTAAMLERHPQLRDACDLIPQQMAFESPEFERAAFLFDSRGDCDLSRIYVCLADSAVGMRVALKLHHQLRDYGVPIVVRTPRSGGLAALVEEQTADATGTGTLKGFGLLEQLCDPDLVLGGTFEMIARAIHEEYVRRQEAQGETSETNPSVTPWEALADHLKESNRAQARHIGVKLREAGCILTPLTAWNAERFQFTDEEVERLAEMEHVRWLEERRQAGWIRGQKDTTQKKSQHLVPWHELSADVKDWDRSTIRSLPRFLAQVDLEIVRLGAQSTLAPAKDGGIDRVR